MVKLARMNSRLVNLKAWRQLLRPVLICALLLSVSVNVSAKINGACSNCHTMHNSQDGSAVAYDVSGTLTATPNAKLLIYATCLGCHTGTNGDGKNIPYVLTTTGINYGVSADVGTGTEGSANTLAGGNFYWVESDDAVGHNVQGLTNSSDGNLTTPPGFSTSFSANGAVDSSWAAGELTCAGTNGCHGEHHDGTNPITDQFQAVNGGHHGDDSTIDGSTVTKSYRFLYGIIGFEDSDWEYRPTSTTHNQYHGDARGSTGAPPSDTSTISYLCAECHGNFHAGSGSLATGTTAASPWWRHPVDFDLSDATGSEYANYGGASHTYQVVTPVASDLGTSVTNTGTTTDLGSVLSTGSDAIVTCISCHRAHGTPHYKMMRWDYAGGIGGDCDNCHTTKN